MHKTTYAHTCRNPARAPLLSTFTYPRSALVSFLLQSAPAINYARSVGTALLNLSLPAPRKPVRTRPGSPEGHGACRGGRGSGGEQWCRAGKLRVVSVRRVDKGGGRHTAEWQRRRPGDSARPRSPCLGSGSSGGGGGGCTFAGLRGSARRAQGPVSRLPADESLYMTRLRLCSCHPRP